ncbi:zinc-dependent alcohol dehydrogenase family protein [Marinospirillum perlucidum]|uniref:zinc-dependent alcohol dehydrogenase family protein n=1 Tax=Marinospirillum perlucidum TaxID=1982602 RepID=UPI000DF2A130|nr:zinc-dependent alcohol dehydrogenase family protein [Marinospirillum perlucidum]
MRAMVIRDYGNYDVFEEAEMPEPQAGPGEVRIRVQASSVNPLELKIRAGLVPAGPELPAILNADVGGLVDQVGEGVTHLQVGDAVIGCAGGLKGRQGALADFMVADARLVGLAPKNLPLEDAAVLPLVFLTAWDALVERANIQPDQWVLIQGGTGGVGHQAVQLAKAKGAKVAASVSSAEKAEIARKLGADATINYREEEPADFVPRITGNEGFAIVFDTAGGKSLDTAFEAVRPGGQVISINTRNSHDLTLMHAKGLTLHVVFRAQPLLTGLGVSSEPAKLAALTQLVEENKLLPLIGDKKFSFTDIAKAHAYLDSGEAVGKIQLVR